jgi:hypothetical protein
VDEIGPIELGSFPIAIYGAMFGATMAGQFAGVALDAVVGHRAVVVPIVCSVLLEALVGARLTRSQVTRSLTVGDWGRLSAYYSMALALLSVPLALWTAASRSPQAPFGGNNPASILSLVLGVLVVLTLLRWGLMTLFGRRAAA